MEYSTQSFSDHPPIHVDPPLPENSPTVIVDDEAEVLDLIRAHLRQAGYPVEPFQSAESALAAIREEEIALLISDLRMPGMDGIDLARRALEERPRISVIILTGAGDEESAAESLRLGVMDYLKKPVDLEELDESIHRVLSRQVQAVYRDKLESWLRREVAARSEPGRKGAGAGRVTVRGLSALLDAMAEYRPMKQKSLHVADLACKISQNLGLSGEMIEQVGVAGFLHNIGMVLVPKVGLAGDRATTKDHAWLGAEILSRLGELSRSVEYVRHHHERLDGSGYPDGLHGEQVPLGAQIVGVAETYVSLLEGDPSTPALTAREALEALRGTADLWYSADVLDGLEQALAEAS